MKEEQSYCAHPDRYKFWPQVRCRNGLTGRCYWEVEWEKEVLIAVTFKKDRDGDERCFGADERSWCLYCCHGVYDAMHNKSKTTIKLPSTSSCNRVGVYLNWPAGTLSFYSVSSDAVTHIHTFYTTFTDSVYPGFGFWKQGSTLSLCKL